MAFRWFALLCVALALPCGAQTPTRQNIANILGFENGTPGAFPAGWGQLPTATTVIDDKIFHGGKYSARIERTAASAGTFGGLATAIPIDFSGKTIEWRGYFRTENVSDSVALAVREDGDTPNLAFGTTQNLAVRGTTDWKEYTATVAVNTSAKTLQLYVLLAGTGRVWVDDLRVLVDGKPVAEAPGIPTIFDTDKEFDAGSRISISSLSSIQVKNLATLARVWGFLKYHHPAITAGKRHWDYDLFRVLPQVLSAGDAATANRAMSTWIASLGTVANCTPCATLNRADLYLGPDLDWLADQSLLGADLSQTLGAIYRNRTPAAKQFFVSLVPDVANPVFDNERTYAAIRFPDSGYQLLGLFRFWNMVQYFYPDRDVMSDDPAVASGYWNKVLEDLIPGIALANSSLTYQQELIKFIAKINDTHANLWTSLAARPPLGTCQLPVDIRFVEGKPMAIRLTSPTAGPDSGLMPGDIIEQLDGVPVTDLVSGWRPMYADSNEPARLRDVANFMTRGACGEMSVTVSRGDDLLDLRPSRVAINTLDFSATYTHDLPGDAFQKLTSDVAYLKLSSVQAARSASYIQAAAGTKGLIVDLRNYPSEFVVFTLGSLLISEPASFARFTFGDVTNPGAFHWTAPVRLTPQAPRYAGKVVILVDEVTQSQAEYTTMAFRAAPGAIVIGSTTAGADGNVSLIPLPGNFSSYFSGLGVFYPDNRPTQRIGIIPDIEVKPTIEGIRAGRDELIEEAIRQITGQ